jgi:spore germination protein YaaH
MLGNNPLNQSNIAKLAGLLLVFAFLAGTLPQPVMAAVNVTCAKYHTVASGDTLSSISVTYDVSVTEIASANSLTTPYTLYLGQQLCIPGTAATTTTTTSSTPKNTWIVERDGNNLVINVANFSKNAIYYVKIKKGHQGTDEPWTKIGTLKTKKNTDVIREFRLPKNFYNTPLITVCLKQVYSNALMCQPFRQ